jgi:phospholipid/cholesterol/gamma-HCH transport system substrate-binding protein
MKLLDAKTSGDLVKLLVFIVVTSLATGVLVVLIGNLTFQDSRPYKAVFSDATGVFQGDDIRIAGVKVGSVSDVQVVDGNRALVSFDVADTATVTRSSTATIRYRNLVGQRYISLTQGVGDLSQLPAGATIPLSRTEPALDLTVLFNGFKPLFAALSPADVNKLSGELIKVFQGEGGNIEGLLRSTASVTSTLAARDQLVGDVIDNLNEVLVTLKGRDQELSDLIVQFRDFIGGLAQDKDAILGSLDSISTLTEQTSQLVTGVRPDLVRSIKELRSVAGNLKAGRSEIDRALQILPIKLTKIGRTAVYGSFFNFYLCEFHGTVLIPQTVRKLVPGPNGSALPKGVRVNYQLPDTGRCNLS